MYLDRRLLTQFDWVLFCLTLLIPFCGLVVLYSAGYNADTNYTLISWLPFSFHSLAFAKQITVLGMGFVALLFCLLLSGSTLVRYSYIFYGLCLIGLVLVLLVGHVSNGSQRWISVMGVKFQPAEPMKLALVLALARYMAKNPPASGCYNFKELFGPALIIGMPVLLIMKQPDLGTALSVLAIGVAMLLFVGVRFKTASWIFCSFIAGIIPAWLWVLKPYQKRRILTLLNPDADPLGSGYHIIQSKIAVGSGSFFGKGFLKGTQTQLEFLPEHTTDFIFSVLAEEWGFIGCALIICLYFALLYRIVRVSVRSKDLYSTYVAFGIGAFIFFHIIINIGMVTGLFPVVGLPLPLFSYGGTSAVSTMVCLGLVLGISMRRLIFAGK